MTAPEVPTVKVLMSPELVEQWASRDIDCNRLVWDWGEPDADGFHTPTVTTDYTDNPVKGERERLRELVKGIENLESVKHYPHGYPPHWPFVVIRRSDALALFADPEPAP